MKITNWAKYCSCVSIMAVSLMACGTNVHDDDANVDSADKVHVQPLPADQAKNLPDMIAMIEVDANGKVIHTEIREAKEKGIKIENAQQAEAVFANGVTARDDSSAESYYSPGYCAPGMGGYYNNTVQYYSSTTISNNNCIPYGNLNYNTPWNGVNYGNTFGNNYSQNTTYYNSSTNYNNGGLANNFPVYGCQGINCYNYANTAWPTYYQQNTQYYSSTTTANNGVGMFGFRYPYANAFFNGGNRYFMQYPCRF